MMATWYIIAATVISLILFYSIFIFNDLTRKRNIVRDQFSQIDVQLKRRFDLIPNLTNMVKGYGVYESTTLKKIVEARNQFMSTDIISKEIAIADRSKGLFPMLFALIEEYPDLKANENYLQLQKDLKDTENMIAIERQFYNDTVLSYNEMLEMFPSNIIATIFRFKPFKFFETNDKEDIEIML